MKQIKLGQDGPMVSAVGYGAMSFTNFYGPADDAESARVLDACVELGITHVDTADVYGMGRSETVIGDWIRARGGEVSRCGRVAWAAGCADHPSFFSTPFV